MLNRILLILVLVSNSVFAQKDLVSVYDYSFEERDSVSIVIGSLSSMVIQAENLESLTLFINGSKEILQTNPHADGHSQLIFPAIKSNLGIELYSSLSQSVKLYTLDVPVLSLNFPENTQVPTDSCKMPQGIDQDIWRAGLPSPTVTPSFNSVNHCIVHHSAGSNSDTNYVEVVRNIYVYHTDVNGWDDIGYNYLIAQDGTLFHGRDGQGQFDDDNVRGAHFCAKNTGTMGICLLGNYLFNPPDTSALNKLEDLMLWKLNKENLNPSDSFRHPLPSGSYLDVISGHKDGCATECPGTFLYAEISNLKIKLENRISNCLPLNVDDEKGYIIDVQIYPNPANEYINIISHASLNMTLYNQMGNIVKKAKLKAGQNTINIKSLKTGVYFARINTESKFYFRRLQVID